MAYLDGTLWMGGGALCVRHVFLKWCFSEYPKILYIEVEMLFETSLSADHDHSRMCVLSELALVLRDSVWLSGLPSCSLS